MSKKLPSKKKTLKSFILDEDAKVIDKTATKIAITSTLISFSIIDSIEKGNAFLGGSHTNHENHNNHINAFANKGTGYHAGDNPTSEAAAGGTLAAKSLTTAHANHFNHQDESQGIGFLGALIGAVGAVAIVMMTGGAGLVGMSAMGNLAGIGASIGVGTTSAGTAAIAATASGLAGGAATAIAAGAAVTAVAGGLAGAVVESFFIDTADLNTGNATGDYIVEPEILTDLQTETEAIEAQAKEAYDGTVFNE